MKKSLVLSLFAFVAVAGVVWAADKLEGAKCPVSGGPVKAESSAEFNGGKVYFCCDNCPKKFAADTATYAAKANHQMAVTGEIVEIACPLTGKPLNKETAIDIDGAKVAFCCNNCKGAVEKMSKDEQITKVFTDVSKSYEPAKKAG